MVFLQDFLLPRDGSHLSAERSKFRMPNFLLFYVFRRTLKIVGENPALYMSPLQNKAQLCHSMLGTCPQTGKKTPTRLVEQKGFCLVNKGVPCQANFACLNVCDDG